jgi:hypothetical protein
MSCFIIPVYPPHFHFLSFLNDTNNVDIYIVLSYKNDYNILQTYNYKNYKTIILEDYLTPDTINNIIAKNVIITFKKYFGLELLYKKYDYIAIIDSEVKFKNTDNIYNLFKEYCNNKQILGANIKKDNRFYNMAQDINISSSMFFNDKEIDILKNITNNFNFYFWFSDIPIYDCKYIGDYLIYINFNDYIAFINKINFYVFDYISYIYYMILNDNYSVIDISNYDISRNWSLEGCNYDIYNKVVTNIKYVPLWIIDYCYTDNINKNIILTYHIDRGSNHVLAYI